MTLKRKEELMAPVMPGPNPELVRRDQERRRSSAAQRHRNRKRELKRPGKSNRNSWRRDANRQ